eukprot:6036259-Prymnesium_polylepis.1
MSIPACSALASRRHALQRCQTARPRAVWWRHCGTRSSGHVLKERGTACRRRVVGALATYEARSVACRRCALQ